MPRIVVDGTEARVCTGTHPLTTAQRRVAERVQRALGRVQAAQELMEGATILRRQYPAPVQRAARPEFEALEYAWMSGNLPAMQARCRLLAQALDAAARALDEAAPTQLAMLDVEPPAPPAPNAIGL